MASKPSKALAVAAMAEVSLLKMARTHILSIEVALLKITVVCRANLASRTVTETIRAKVSSDHTVLWLFMVRI